MILKHVGVNKHVELKKEKENKNNNASVQIHFWIDFHAQ